MIYDITINDLKDPIIDSIPRISWKLDPEKNDFSMSAYRIIVMDADTDSVVWDSSFIKSSKMRYIPITANLKPLNRYKCIISIKDQQDKIYQSESFFFSTGKLKDKWTAKWIRAHFAKDKSETNQCASYLRKTFNTDKPVKKAILAICGLGQFYAMINGKKIHDDFLPTPYTDFSKRVLYRVYDVKKFITEGSNAIAVILGNGFYNSTTKDPWQSSTAIWKDCPKLLSELHIYYEDGTQAVINSDSSWKSSKGPIVFNGMRHGEHYDARLYQKDWELVSFNDSSWGNCAFSRAPGGILQVMEMQPIRIRYTLKPVAKWKTDEGWIIDCGRSVSGVAKIAIKGKRNSTVRIRYSDILHEDGSLNQEALASFNQDAPFHTDIYTKADSDIEYFYPIFSYHGFRYIEINTDYEPQLSDFEIWVLANELDTNANFECADNTVNRIQNLCIRSSESMLYSLMASDTAREQTSWTGDTGLSVEQMAINFESLAFFRNWQKVLREAQLQSGTVPCIVPSAGWGYNGLNGPDWSHPIYEVPMQFYRYYGDKQMIKDNYEALSKYCEYLDVMANNGIVKYGLGDWCPPFIGKAISINMESFKCPVEVSDTAYYYSTLKAAQKSALILKKHKQAEDFKKRADIVKQAFRSSFFDKSTYTVKGNCQTATAIMIFHDLAEKAEIPFLTDRLISQIKDNGNALDFGILGQKAVLNALGDNGFALKALKIITKEGFPSMKNWLDMGATTLWECWNGEGSRNHHMFSCVSEFFYKHIAGIMPSKDACGFDKITFAPPFDMPFSHAFASINTPNGLARISWEKDNEMFTISIKVPYNSKGFIYLPKEYNNKDVKEALAKNGYRCLLCEDKKDRYIVKVRYGTYDIKLM
ncbi:MAG: Bacterial alpha-L-rhamnosidase [Firmicutes bacterium ADurb.Bin146]|nr:MAG: Bacterial alpha-L-rhamnosidase [Firmicutes bacterium ADurb.Bin146]